MSAWGNVRSRSIAFFPLISSCPHGDILEWMLGELNRLDGALNPVMMDQHRLVDSVAEIRKYIRKGYESDLSVREPAIYFENERFRLSMLDMELPNTNPGMDFLTSKADSLLGISDSAMRGLHQMFSQNDAELVSVEKRAKANFDILRLSLANRIVELEAGNKVTDPKEFVGRFFDEELPDPFSNSSFLWDATNEVFYSVGEDGIDGGNRREYHTYIGHGDVSLLSRPDPELEKKRENLPPFGFGMPGMVFGATDTMPGMMPMPFAPNMMEEDPERLKATMTAEMTRIYEEYGEKISSDSGGGDN